MSYFSLCTTDRIWQVKDYLNIPDQFSLENPNEVRRAKETNGNEEWIENEPLNRLSDAPPAHCNNRLVGQNRNEAFWGQEKRCEFKRNSHWTICNIGFWNTKPGFSGAVNPHWNRGLTLISSKVWVLTNSGEPPNYELYTKHLRI